MGDSVSWVDVRQADVGENGLATSVVDARRDGAFADGPEIVWNHPETLDRIILAQAAATPDAPAVIDRGIETSFRELIALASARIAALRERRVPSGARIGVCAEVSAEFFASVIAIWAVGATYVPLDPDLPQPRLQQIAGDAQIALLLVDRLHDGILDAPDVIVLDEIAANDSAAFTSDARPDDLAYIIYTSGSTGLPKGVAVRHASLRNVILASSARRSFSPRDRELYRSAIAFDVSLEEMFCPIVAGGAVVLTPRSAWGDPRAFAALLVETSATGFTMSPSLLAVLLDEPTFAACSSLRIVNCGGEALSAGLRDRFFAATSASLINSYGPSESAIVVTMHTCTPADRDNGERTAPIGTPLPNNHVSVRDAELVPVAPGETGEIYIGGIQLAQGYINRDAETAARFIADPLRPGERLYRTGDLARRRDDGTIVFLGRNDNQVKIRGVRVEPAEVAAAIERLDGVRSAIVVAKQRKDDGLDDSPILAAYVTQLSGATLDPVNLRRALRAELPPTMVPSEIVIVDDFPLTITGKVDEKALVARESLAKTHIVHADASTNSPFRAILHEQLRTIWEELLNVDGIHDDDDFFDIGGDSLMAVTLVARLEETFGRSIPLLDVFNSMTIAGLGELLSSDRELIERDAIVVNASGTLPPLIYLHGDLAGGLYSWALAKGLGDDQPVLVIPPHGMRGRAPATDVERMASDTVATIARYYPSGPLRIAGYSAAGLVAYEAARQLRKAGRTVLEVMIIGFGAENVAFTGLDALLRRAGLSHASRAAVLRRAMYIGFRLRRTATSSPREQWQRVRRFLERKPKAPAPRNHVEAEFSALLGPYYRAHDTYIPRPYDGRVTLIWPTEQPFDNGDPRAHWSRVAPDLTLAFVPGTHDTAVSRYVADIADIMRR